MKKIVREFEKLASEHPIILKKRGADDLCRWATIYVLAHAGGGRVVGFSVKNDQRFKEHYAVYLGKRSVFDPTFAQVGGRVRRPLTCLDNYPKKLFGPRNLRPERRMYKFRLRRGSSHASKDLKRTRRCSSFGRIFLALARRLFLFSGCPAGCRPHLGGRLLAYIDGPRPHPLGRLVGEVKSRTFWIVTPTELKGA